MAQFRATVTVDFRDHETLTVTTTGCVVLTDAKIHPPNAGSGTNMEYALISLEGVPIRFWVDGTCPVGSSGHVGLVNDVVELEGSNNLANFRVITTAGTATLQVSYGR